MAMAAMAGEWWGFGDGNVPNMIKNGYFIGKMIMNYGIFGYSTLFSDKPKWLLLGDRKS
jgi:hypothetical protein